VEDHQQRLFRRAGDELVQVVVEVALDQQRRIPAGDLDGGVQAFQLIPQPSPG
jgi:hypothetical protein